MDGGEPAHVGAAHYRMLALCPRKEVAVLLVAVVDGLVSSALGVYVHDGVQKAAARGETGGQRDIAGLRGRGSRSLQRKLCCGSAGTDYAEVLAAAYPPAAETVQKVWPKLPVEPADDGIAAELRDARICGRTAAEINLTPVRTQAAGIGVAAKEVNLLGKAVVQLDANAVRFEFPWHCPTEPKNIHTISARHRIVIASRHLAPKRLDGGADAEMTRIAVSCS